MINLKAVFALSLCRSGDESDNTQSCCDDHHSQCKRDHGVSQLLLAQHLLLRGLRPWLLLR